jgi:hypothetical protein
MSEEHPATVERRFLEYGEMGHKQISGVLMAIISRLS